MKSVDCGAGRAIIGSKRNPGENLFEFCMSLWDFVPVMGLLIRANMREEYNASGPQFPSALVRSDGIKLLRAITPGSRPS